MRTLIGTVAASCLAVPVLAAPAAAQSPAAATSRSIALGSPEAKKIERFFVKFQETVAAKQSVQPYFDIQAMLAEAGRVGGPRVTEVLGNPNFQAGVRQGMAKTFRQNFERWAWKRAALRRLSRRGDGIIVVYARVWIEGDVAEGKRWWLREDSSWAPGYRIVDGESLQIGLRMTAGMGSAATTVLARDNGRTLGALQSINAAMTLFQQGEISQAAQRCIDIPDGVLPKGFVGLRLMILSAEAGSREDPEQQLAYVAEGRRLNLDLPILHYLEATGLVAIGEAVKAEAAGRAYLAEVGADPDGYWVVGRALADQDRAEAAIAMFRKGLDDDPSSSDNFGELVVLWPDGYAEFAVRMTQMPNAVAAFDSLAALALQEQRFSTVEQLCLGLKTVAAADPNIDFYMAQVLMQRDGDPAGAAKRLDGAMDRAPKEELTAYVEEYCYAMTLTGKPLEAYARVTLKAFAFQALATELAVTDLGLLEKLVAAHRPSGEGDPWLHHFDAEVKVGKKAYAAADKLYDRAWRMTGAEEARETIRQARAYALVHDGKWREAYTRCQPAEATFRQVAGLLNSAEDGAALAALCDLHATADPSEVMVAVWRGEALALQGKHAEAITLAVPSLELKDDALFNNAARRCVLSYVALKRFDRALAVAKRSTARDGDPWWQLVVAAAQGDATESARLMAHLVTNGTNPDAFWHDAHVAKALESNPAFAKLKKQYPHEDH
jgi:tetratricopeptide (TPR) repeat protein